MMAGTTEVPSSVSIVPETQRSERPADPSTTLEELDAQIEQLKSQIDHETQRRETLISALLPRLSSTTAATTTTTTLAQDPGSNPALPSSTSSLFSTRRSESEKQQQQQQQQIASLVENARRIRVANSYRLGAGCTMFESRDPDPNAPDGGRVVGVRIEVYSRTERKFLAPAYVLLRKEAGRGGDRAGENETMDLDGGGETGQKGESEGRKNNWVGWKVHRHTLPPGVAAKLEGWSSQWLRHRERGGRRRRDAEDDEDGADGNEGQDESPSDGDEYEDAATSNARRQRRSDQLDDGPDLPELVRAVRTGVLAHQRRLETLSRLRASRFVREAGFADTEARWLVVKWKRTDYASRGNSVGGGIGRRRETTPPAPGAAAARRSGAWGRPSGGLGNVLDVTGVSGNGAAIGGINKFRINEGGRVEEVMKLDTERGPWRHDNLLKGEISAGGGTVEGLLKFVEDGKIYELRY